jgi:LytS/YehU family sensor histidine kinase
MIAGVFHASLYYRDLRRRHLREADLEARLAHAELNVLRMQLQPHFLFNALHTISSLMETDVPTARRVIASLGDLLRSSIDHTARQEVSLGAELAFVERYLDIQRARFRQRLRFEIDVAPETVTALVPSLVLQPLVENAVRHGIEPSAAGGTVRITAARDGSRLSLVVRNEAAGDGVDAGRAHESKPGIGLSNVASRLTQLYGDAHTLRAERLLDGAFQVSMSLPFRRELAPMGAAQGVEWPR